MSINGVSTGHAQTIYSSNGATYGSAETSSPSLDNLNASSSLALDLSASLASGTTLYTATESKKESDTSFATIQIAGRVAQSADISSITFTGNQTNGIGAGSYIIVERVDADLSQDLGWQDYTPTCYIDLTSATTVPNITPSVRYRVQGKTLFMQGTLNFTGAPTGATDLAISLPTGVNVVSLVAASKMPYIGKAACSNAGGGGIWDGRVRLPLSTENSGRVAFRPQTAISTYNSVSTTVPFTWANGHQLEFDFFTEIQ
jgi:hypothetical protein